MAPGRRRAAAAAVLALLLGCLLELAGHGFVQPLARERRPLGAARRTSDDGRTARRASDFNKDAFLRADEFDALAWRDFRREALLQYRGTQQSGTLRLGIFIVISLVGLLALALGPKDPGLAYQAGAALAALAGAGLFLDEREKRTQVLVRLEREYALGDLRLEMVDPATRLAKKLPVQKLRGRFRVVALYGSGAQLREALAGAAAYKRRLLSSSAIVVPVSSGDVDEAREAALAVLGGEPGVRAAAKWLAFPFAGQDWADYFEELLVDRGGTGGRGLWAAFSFRGRVLGSNFSSPIWDELLAAMSPQDKPLWNEGPQEATSKAEEEVLEAQTSFYQALLAGDEETIAGLFSKVDDQELSFSLQVAESGQDTNLSPWYVVLAEGNRPELVVASQDVTLRGADEAVTTCIEFPVLGPSLLATQIWRRTDTAWELRSHRTIPYDVKTEARVALRCDHRGCIAFGKLQNAMQ